MLQFGLGLFTTIFPFESSLTISHPSFMQPHSSSSEISFISTRTSPSLLPVLFWISNPLSTWSAVKRPDSINNSPNFRLETKFSFFNLFWVWMPLRSVSCINWSLVVVSDFKLYTVLFIAPFAGVFNRI